MAIVRTSGLADDFKGKLNGDVFQSNQGGLILRGGKMYCRTALYYNNPQKFLQPFLSAAWATLSVAERTSWATNASLYPVLTRYGVSRTPSAYNLFCRLNGTLVSCGLPFVITSSAPVGLTDISGCKLLQSTAGPLRVNFTTTLAANEQIIISCTPPISNGRTMPIGYWRKLHNGIVPGSKQVIIQPQWTSAFGHLIRKQTIWGRVYVINTVTGEKSDPTYISVITS